MPRKASFSLRVSIGCLLLIIVGCAQKQPQPGTVLDEAMRAGKTAKDFSPAGLDASGHDYFHDMDSGIGLSPAEVQGRVTWIVWTGGNDRFWDLISVRSAGALDFLKTLSSYPGVNGKGALAASRKNRWRYLGLVNEPCFKQADAPDPDRWGLWLDKRDPTCSSGADPFEDQTKYPGVKIGARGTTVQGKELPVGSFYGWASGIVGLRLFPNPDFDDAAAKKWDPVKYYTDPNYYNDSKLIKPYRVGMSCGFCHVGPNPLKPPADPENPKWENLSSNVGAQYFWIDRIFDWDNDPTSFILQLFHASKPGTLDTSLVSTDNIDNPRTMNAVYSLRPRLERALLAGKETLGGGSEDNKQFNEFVKPDDPTLGWLTKLCEPAPYCQSPAESQGPGPTVFSPRVLKDGSDSVGGLGALNRVYLNIGLFSEEWLLHFNPLVGGKITSPIKIEVARKNSTYWLATEQQTVNMALFFLKSTDPQKLDAAPGGAAELKKGEKQLTQGKQVFADRCARCHSSKLPPLPPGKDPGTCSGPNYLACWNNYWALTKTPAFKAQMHAIVMKDDFLKDNFLASEFRVPVTLLETNACSPLATNAIRNNIWDNFSSETYKELPSVGNFTYYHPVTGAAMTYLMPGGGRGFTRPASLISLWSTAPFLLNNSVGRLDPLDNNDPDDLYNPSPGVAERLASFSNSIDQMLSPEHRVHDPQIGDKIPPRMVNGRPLQLPSAIARTTTTSFLRVPRGYLPGLVQNLIGPLEKLFPFLLHNGEVEIGPIPSGTPVNLLANIDLLGEDADGNLLTGPAKVQHDLDVAALLLNIKSALKAVPTSAPDRDEQAKKIFLEKDLVNQLMKFSKCPDYVVNRGHYFGTSYFQNPDGTQDEPGLSDDEKLALIEFLKTF
ncbi:MAG TPA: hypothetical protein VK724_06145 [Bryobacteraceae bacterium]|nr:hypothetical protein [Bryobacteraceae bacterium]